MVFSFIFGAANQNLFFLGFRLYENLAHRTANALQDRLTLEPLIRQANKLFLARLL